MYNMFYAWNILFGIETIATRVILKKIQTQHILYTNIQKHLWLQKQFSNILKPKRNENNLFKVQIFIKFLFRGL